MKKLMLENQIDLFLTAPARNLIKGNSYEINLDVLIEQLENDGFENLDKTEVLNIVLN
ncbi:hypothetical protein HC931_25620 [Candidatus Gracilibacteria bacterium]|nr:hypothetical protein [Candidatus Gracilibacteria bacterium]